MTSFYEFKVLENAVIYAEEALKRGAGYVLIQTIETIPSGVYYAVTVIGDLDGISPPRGYEKQPITSTNPLSEDGSLKYWSEYGSEKLP